MRFSFLTLNPNGAKVEVYLPQAGYSRSKASKGEAVVIYCEPNAIREVLNGF